MASTVWLKGTDPASIAQAIKDLKAKPTDKRCLLLAALNHAVFENPADHPPALAWPNGIAAALQTSTALAKALPATDVVLDLESPGMPSRWNDALDKAKAAATLGLPAPTDEASGLAFDQACSRLSRAAIRAGIFAPLRKALPNRMLCQYGDLIVTDADGFTDINGHSVISDGVSGNAWAPAFYGSGSNNDPQTLTAWGNLRKSLDNLRACERNAPGRGWPWITGPSFAGVWQGKPEWAEFQRHLLLTTNRQALLWNPGQPDAAPALAAVLKELDQAGGDLPDYLVSAEPIPVNANLIVTARTNDRMWPTRIVARVTTAPGASLPDSVTIAGVACRVVKDCDCGGWVSN